MDERRSSPSSRLSPLELALGEGTPRQRRAAAARLAAEPHRAAEVGEHLDLLQRIRSDVAQLRPGFTQALLALESRYHSRVARARRVRQLTVAAAAAALLLATLGLWPQSLWPLARGAPLLQLPSRVAYVGELLDLRMQRLAASLVSSLPQRLDDPTTDPVTIAHIASALAASGLASNGARFGPDLRAATTWLERRLPDLHGGPLACALAALGEVAGVNGDALQALRLHGRRLVGESLAARDAKTASLLSPSTPAEDLAEAGRLLAIAPAFGVDPADAARLRRSLAARLESRCQREGEPPDLLAALLYGYADLTGRDDLARKLVAWRPTAIAASDLPVLQRFAASLEPGMRGRAELLLRLRQLAACPLPEAPMVQADLLLCLARSSFIRRTYDFSRLVAFANRS